jgi:hypothetical protein
MGKIERKKLKYNFAIIPQYKLNMQENREIIKPLFEFCDRKQILCSSLVNHAFDRFFGIITNSRKSEQMKTSFRKTIFSKIIRKNIEIISNRLLLYGRMNDSIPHLEKAINLGNLSARADLALLCFNQQLSDNECKKVTKLLKEGVELGCQNCQGMLGYRHSLAYDFDLAYRHAIESTDAGSIYGKFALAKLLHTLSSYIPDEYEQTFYILSDDKFICNFMKRNLADVDDADDPNVLNSYDQRRIAGILFNEIREEYAKNPMCPKVWVSLPTI